MNARRGGSVAFSLLRHKKNMVWGLLDRKKRTCIREAFPPNYPAARAVVGKKIRKEECGVPGHSVYVGVQGLRVSHTLKLEDPRFRRILIIRRGAAEFFPRKAQIKRNIVSILFPHNTPLQRTSHIGINASFCIIPNAGAPVISKGEI